MPDVRGHLSGMGHFATRLIAGAASAIGLIVLSLVVDRCLGPAWSRRIGAGYNAT